MHPNQTTATRSTSVARQDERTSTIILTAVPQVYPKMIFQNNIQNIPLLPRSVLPVALGVFLCLSTHSMVFRPGEASSSPGYTTVARPFSSSRRSPVHWRPVALAP